MDSPPAITNLLAEYCEHFDAGDFDDFGALFAHGTWFPTTAEGEGAGPVRRWCEENILLYDGAPRTKHVTINIWLDIDDDTAQARSYVTIWQGLTHFPLQAIFSGRYHDTLAVIDGRWCFVSRLAVIDGRWRFVSRLALPDVIGDMSWHMRSPFPPGPLRQKL